MREKFILVVLVLVIIWMGVYPNPFLRKIDVSSAQVVRRVGAGSTQIAGREAVKIGGQTK